MNPICTECKSQNVLLEKCFECKKKYCPDYLWRGMVNNKTKQNDEAKIVCNECKKKYRYISL
jgi:hypothetical protein